MRRLYPADGAEESDLIATYAYPDELNRPWVRANMVSSIDGAVTVGGRSGGLSTPFDKQIFALLRALADVVLVGAGTVRAEGYGPGRIRQDYAALRENAGQPPAVPIAIVSRSLDLDLSSTLFRETRPIVITCSSAPRPRLELVERSAEIVMAGDRHVDLDQAAAALQERGLRRVLCEGGPRLLGDLVHAELLDELCLSVSPLIAGGAAPRIVSADNALVRMALRSLLEEDGALFARYVRS
jgi:riboflavin biosynthesis pyrimidine reductase